jgi:hypothetical protein
MEALERKKLFFVYNKVDWKCKASDCSALLTLSRVSSYLGG